MNLEAAAVAYARAGYAVFPLEAGGKRPMIPKHEGGNGVHDACTDVRTILGWWHRYPFANVGLALREDWIVIDVDVRNGGLATVREWKAAGLRLPASPLQVTPSGGYHVVLVRPEGALAATAGAGVDVLGVGRYIVAAPSRIDGKCYAWRARLSSTPVAPCPAWLRAKIVKPEIVASRSPAYAAPVLADRYLAQALSGEIELVATAPQGTRNHALNKSTHCLARLIGRGLTEREVIDAMTHAGERAGLPRWEVERTIESAVRARKRSA